MKFIFGKIKKNKLKRQNLGKNILDSILQLQSLDMILVQIKFKK